MNFKSFVMIMGTLFFLFPLPVSAKGQIPSEVKHIAVVHPGAVISQVRVEQLGGGRNLYNIDLEINKPYKDVISFYRQVAETKKWKVFREVNRDYGYMLMCHDGHYKIDITANSSGNKVMVRLTLEKQY